MLHLLEMVVIAIMEISWNACWSFVGLLLCIKFRILAYLRQQIIWKAGYTILLVAYPGHITGDLKGLTYKEACLLIFFCIGMICCKNKHVL